MLFCLRLYLYPLSILLLVALIEKGLFALYHGASFGELSLPQMLHAIIWGFKFDLAISSAFAFFAYLGAYLLHRIRRIDAVKALRHLTFTAAAILLLLHGADMIYYGEAGRHLGYELKEGINSGASLATAVVQTYTWPVVWQLLLLLPLYWWIYAVFRRIEAGQQPLKMAAPGFEASLGILFLASAVMVRGGPFSVPLEPLHAQEIGDTQRATLALNGAYNALFSSLTPYSIQPLFAAPPGPEEHQRVLSLYRGQPAPPLSPARPYNVVMVLLESWSGAFIGSYGFDKTTTPVFDELRRKSLTSRAMFAGGHRTTEGMFATLCSWQNPLGQTVAQSQLQNYDYDCLPEVLRKHGYSTSFFQGSLENTSGTGAFAQLLGFSESYGKEDVSEHKLPYNSWGLHDPDLYAFALKKLHDLPKPFFVGINTNSTHDWNLPAGIEAQFAPEESLGGYLNTLHFADAALGDFIHAVQSDPEFGDTLFVLVADHPGPTPPELMRKYLIPFAIYAPGLVTARELEQVASQRDIAPTVMHLLGMTPATHFSGQSLLTPGVELFADYYHTGVLGWFEGNRGVEFTLDEERPSRCFSLDMQTLATKKETCNEPGLELMQRARAFTHLSQSLLFEGKIKTFSQLHRDE